MRNLILLITFVIISCGENSKRKIDFHDITIEWLGEIDKPIYKIVICNNCSFYQSVELCKLRVSDKTMRKIMEIGIEKNELIINEQNGEEGIRWLDQIYKILKENKASEVNLKIIQNFKKRIS